MNRRDWSLVAVGGTLGVVFGLLLALLLSAALNDADPLSVDPNPELGPRVRHRDTLAAKWQPEKSQWLVTGEADNLTRVNWKVAIMNVVALDEGGYTVGSTRIMFADWDAGETEKFSVAITPEEPLTIRPGTDPITLQIALETDASTVADD